MERHNGSSEERWSQEKRRKERRTQEHSQKREKGRTQVNKKEDHQEAPLTTHADKRESRLNAGFFVVHSR
jgi:hypothetical protein